MPCNNFVINICEQWSVEILCVCVLYIIIFINVRGEGWIFSYWNLIYYYHHWSHKHVYTFQFCLFILFLVCVLFLARGHAKFYSNNLGEHSWKSICPEWYNKKWCERTGWCNMKIHNTKCCNHNDRRVSMSAFRFHIIKWIISMNRLDRNLHAHKANVTAHIELIQSIVTTNKQTTTTTTTTPSPKKLSIFNININIVSFHSYSRYTCLCERLCGCMYVLIVNAYACVYHLSGNFFFFFFFSSSYMFFFLSYLQ